MTVWDLERRKTGYDTSVIIAVVILYEIVSIGGCALYLKMKERKNKADSCGRRRFLNRGTEYDMACGRGITGIVITGYCKNFWYHAAGD